MNLEKAIKISGNYIVTRNATLDPDVKEAIRLGIEALKFRLELEQEDPQITLEPLPGETEE